MKRTQKNYDELTFADDFMFCQVMTADPELCRRVLEVILGIPIKKVIVNKQYEKKFRNDRKGIRLDVYADDTENNVYDIEMQTSGDTPIPKRSRYYQGILDIDHLKSGEDYRKLPKSYIIFICTFDYFGLGLPIYTFVKQCQEEPTLYLNDETTVILLNPYSQSVPVSEELRDFLDYLLDGIPKGELTNSIESNIAKAKDNEEWRLAYMTLEMILQEERSAAMAEGIAKGKEKERKRTLSVFFQNGGTKELAKTLLGATDEELSRLEEEIK